MCPDALLHSLKAAKLIFGAVAGVGDILRRKRPREAAAAGAPTGQAPAKRHAAQSDINLASEMAGSAAQQLLQRTAERRHPAHGAPRGWGHCTSRTHAPPKAEESLASDGALHATAGVHQADGGAHATLRPPSVHVTRNGARAGSGAQVGADGTGVRGTDVAVKREMVAQKEAISAGDGNQR